MKDFKSIIVAPGNTVSVSNPTLYPLIGRGSQGAVFRLTDISCVKIYAREAIAKLEAEAYEKGKGSSFVPALYETGPNYMIIEYVKGRPLDEYLKSHGNITGELTQKLLSLLDEMKRFGFPRIDCQLRHILLTNEGGLKLIDLAHSFKLIKKRPSRLFKDLGKLHLLEEFAKHVEKLNPELYVSWKDTIDRYL